MSWPTYNDVISSIQLEFLSMISFRFNGTLFGSLFWGKGFHIFEAVGYFYTQKMLIPILLSIIDIDISRLYKLRCAVFKKSEYTFW